jgi:hypothetical protein
MGLIWRLYSVVRLEERDGGGYMDVEVVALSRDIPAVSIFINASSDSLAAEERND